MNERIKELMEQAEQASSNACYDEPNQLYLMNYVIEKFAELIVRECAEIARNADLEDVDGGDSAVLRAAANQIKEHFGV